MKLTHIILLVLAFLSFAILLVFTCNTDSKSPRISSIPVVRHDFEGFQPVVIPDLEQQAFASQWLSMASRNTSVLKDLAAKDEVGAMVSLGQIYKNGNGVLQNYILSHMWFNIASANGDDAAGLSRDSLARQMTNDDISKALSMARDCTNSGYVICEFLRPADLKSSKADADNRKQVLQNIQNKEPDLMLKLLPPQRE